MDMSSADGLSKTERGEFHLVCRICSLHWSDFEVHVEYEGSGTHGRKGRKLAHVLYRVSGRHRTYRAGAGNNWISAFEEDIRAHCSTRIAKSADRPRRYPSLTGTGASESVPRTTESGIDARDRPARQVAAHRLQAVIPTGSL